MEDGRWRMAVGSFCNLGIEGALWRGLARFGVVWRCLARCDQRVERVRGKTDTLEHLIDGLMHARETIACGGLMRLRHGRPPLFGGWGVDGLLTLPARLPDCTIPYIMLTH